MMSSNGRRCVLCPKENEAKQLLAEATVVIPPSLAGEVKPLFTELEGWFYENSERIVLELFVHPVNNELGSCDTHDIAFSSPCEIGVFPSSIEGGTAFSLSEERANERVTSALESLLCHSVSHGDAVLLDAVLLRGALLAERGRDCFAFLCMWALLLVRCSPNAQSRTALLEDLARFANPPDETHGPVLWRRALRRVIKLRNNWKRCFQHESPYRRVVSLEDEHRCDCGSGRDDDEFTEVAGPVWTMFLARCKREEGYCGYRVASGPIPGRAPREKEADLYRELEHNRMCKSAGVRMRIRSRPKLSSVGPDGKTHWQGTQGYIDNLYRRL
jgi:hypothetical protein